MAVGVFFVIRFQLFCYGKWMMFEVSAEEEICIQPSFYQIE